MTHNPAHPTWRGPAWLQQERRIAALEAQLVKQQACIDRLHALLGLPSSDDDDSGTPPAAALPVAAPDNTPPPRPRWMAAGRTTIGHTELTVLGEDGYPIGERPSAAARHAAWREEAVARAVKFAREYTYAVVPREPWEVAT